MREKIGSSIAAFVFTVLVPGIIFTMIPHVDPRVGWPVIGVSILVGITALAWGFWHLISGFGA